LHIADRETIENQFSFLYRPKEGYNTLENVRTVFGRPHSYPATEEFIEELKKRKGSGAPRSKDPIA
jgi:hypothetical protein